MEDDDDQAYVRLRAISRVWRDWIEVEFLPGYYYRWETQDTSVWGFDLRVSILYESALGNSPSRRRAAARGPPAFPARYRWKL
jgi:hypothetical protein